MKFVDEFRKGDVARKLAADIARQVTQPWTLMEVCGGQTHAIVRYGIDQLLPDAVELIHGPGCPVCVTPIGLVDQAIALAKQDGLTLMSFGDMARVPGSQDSLLSARAGGADVRLVYSPLEAVQWAEAHPEQQVVFFAVGFETTAPATALAVETARRRGVKNFSLLVAHVQVPPAIEAIMQSPNCRVQGFLAAGHVCTIMGTSAYQPLSARWRVPIVVTGFEPVDILRGVLSAVTQLEQGRFRVENQYERAVRYEGNQAAQQLLQTVFEPAGRNWRGIGVIPASGLALRPAYATFDAALRFGKIDETANTETECRAGAVLQGQIKPPACPAFGAACTPQHPLGAPMVSSEGACAAYYRHRVAELEAADVEV